MTVKNYLWMFPFFCFLLGYFIIYQTVHVEKVKVPSLVGKTAAEALAIVSSHNLNLRLLAHKEEADLPEGTILSQTPPAKQIIRPYQSVFVVISKKPPPITASNFINQSIHHITQQIADTNIRARIYYLPTSYPYGRCFAQSPKPNEALEQNQLLLYISSGNNKPIIWPDFTGRLIAEVMEFLELYHIKPHLIHSVTHTPTHTYTHCSIIEQRPLPGTLVTIDNTKPLSVQFRVQS